MSHSIRQAASLKEIARQCNLAISTVSRVLSGADLSAASEEVRRKIWRVAEASGYLARLHQRGRKMAVKNASLSLAFVFARNFAPDSGQFFAEIVHGLEQISHERQYRLTGIFRAEEDFVLPDASGLIILGYSGAAWIERLKNHYPHVVCLGLAPLTGQPCDQVLCNGRLAARTAVEYLAGLGHSRIGYMGETGEEHRWQGYSEAMNSLGLKPEFIYPTPLSASGGYTAGQELCRAKNRPSAVFCANDITALGLLRAAKENNLSIPNQLSVIGIDDIEMTNYCSPPLTSIQIPKQEMASLAVKILSDRIYGGHCLPLRLEVPFCLMERQSCCPPQD